MAARLIILKGLPASGKTTWAKAQCEATGAKRVNKDDLRAMLDAGQFSKGNEQTIEAARDALVRILLEREQVVIVDDTNFSPKHEQRLRSIAANTAIGREAIPVEVRTFLVPLHECLQRNALRKRPVPPHVIKSMHKKWLADAESFQYAAQDVTLPPATIFDIDGTLAFHVHRGPYDHEKAGADLVNEPVARFVDLARGPCSRDTIVFLSGRSDEYRELTEGWLRKNGLFCNGDLLLMRARKDRRDDVIVKRALYERHVKDHFYVCAVFDDRDKVVAMWREIGLPCFQVRPGDF